MSGCGALLVGSPKTNDGPTINNAGLNGFSSRFFNGPADRFRIVAIRTQHLPTVCFEASVCIVGEPLPHFAINRYTIVVVKHDQFTQLQSSSQRTDLMGYSFHQAAIANKYVSIVVYYLVPFSVELGRESLLRNRHAYSIGQPLA